MSSVQDAKKLPVASAAPASANVYPFYAWRIWYGMTFSTWFRIFAANRFAISPTRIPRAARGLIISILNSTVSVIQDFIFARPIRRSVLERPPIFIIGHWRTGTTHLHEMLTCDERFIAPNTLECFVPGQGLVMGRMLRLLSFLLPEKRPMDNMLLGWDQPQEDEFALLNIGLGSPYETMLFPNRRRVHHRFLNMTDVPAKQFEAWKAGLVNFLQQVNYRGIRQAKPSIGTRSILLKSPTHTARVRFCVKYFRAQNSFTSCAIRSKYSLRRSSFGADFTRRRDVSGLISDPCLTEAQTSTNMSSIPWTCSIATFSPRSHGFPRGTSARYDTRTSFESQLRR